MSQTWRFGLLGQNISYSLSPRLYQAIAHSFGDKCHVDLLDVPPENVGETLGSIRTSSYHGVAVTIPYKETVLSFLEDVDPFAEQVRAVNSIACSDGLKGHNTDSSGFARSLQEYRSLLAKGTALIIGTGAAARTVAHVLVREYGLERIVVSGRSDSKLRQFESWSRELLGILPAIQSTSLHQDDSQEFRIVINCTPLGGWNFPNDNPVPPDVVWKQVGMYYDLNYNPGNRAIEAARRSSCIAIDGSHMLVGQAIESFRLWTGLTTSFEPIYEQVFKAD